MPVAEQRLVHREYQRWSMSQFLHGEEGALTCAAKIVQLVPGHDARLFAATQVVDEAQHVEVYTRLLAKMGGSWPRTGPLGTLLDQVLADPRWDMTYLGMQVLIEGRGLAAFNVMRDQATGLITAVAAGHEELAHARTFLADAFAAELCPDMLLLARDGDGRPVGAAAIAWAPHGKPPAFPTLIRPAEPRIVAALTREAAAVCAGEASALRSWAAVQEGSAEEHALRAAGWKTRRRTLHFHADGARFHAMVRAILDRLDRAPGFRGGWANVALLERATWHGLAGDATGFEFHCDDHVRDTLGLARRSSSRQLAVKLELDFELPPLALQL